MVDRRRTLGAVARDAVIVWARGALGIRGADRDHVRVVAGRGDRAVAAGLAGIVPSVVAGGDYDHNPGLPRGFYGLAQRIESVAFKNRPAQRQIDHADVVSVLEGDRGLNGGDLV